MLAGDTVLTVPAARYMDAGTRLGVAGASIGFLLSLLVQRFYLKIYDRSVDAVHTEDDATVTLSLVRYFRQMSRLALPTWFCREAAGSMIFILLFAVKAVLRVRVSKANGAVLGAVLHGEPASRTLRFTQAILSRGAIGLALAMCSGAIQGIRPWLVGCYRVRLSRLFQRRFYERLVYYQATVLDDRLEAADTVIATYCGEFSEHFAELPYYFLLPGFECMISTYALVQQSGLRSAALMSAVVTVSVLLLRRLSPQFGRIHSLLLSREDNYRRMLTNDLNNVENIAMHDAGEFTRSRLDGSLGKLKYTLDHMSLAKGNFVMLEGAFTTLLTLVAYSVAFLTSKQARSRSHGSDIYLQIQLIEDLNSSVRDFVVNFRELSHLTEFTMKLAEFDSTLESIAAGTFINNTHSVAGAASPTSVDAPRKFTDGEPDDSEEVSHSVSQSVSSPLTYTEVVYSDNIGKGGDVFELVNMEDVVLRSPAGQLLFAGMNISIKSNEDWVIIGDNGCGKTSLLRMLCGLWLPSEGRLTLDKSVVFLLAPQHVYMAQECTLFEQISFPRKPVAVTPEVKARVRRAIELAGAHTVIDVIGGYGSRIMGFRVEDTDESYEWGSLSGGQKQRISMARVFYHVLSMDRSKRTPVAILDEATSMMDVTEQDVLNNMRRLDIRMISVTHRDVVIRHHTNVLKIRPNGTWTMERVQNRVAVGERVESISETV